LAYTTVFTAVASKFGKADALGRCVCAIVPHVYTVAAIYTLPCGTWTRLLCTKQIT